MLRARLLLHLHHNRENADERGECGRLGSVDEGKRADTGFGRDWLVVNLHERTEQRALQGLQPRVCVECGGIEAVQGAVLCIETPTNAAVLEMAHPHRDVRRPGAEVPRDERVRGNGHELIEIEPGRDQLEQCRHQLCARAELPQRTVGHHEWDTHVIPADLDRLVEHRLENRGGRGHVGAENDDFVRLQVGKILKRMQQCIVEHLDLARQAVGTMDAHRPIVGKRVLLTGLVCIKVSHTVLQTMQQRSSRIDSRNRHVAVVDPVSVGRQQQLQVECALHPCGRHAQRRHRRVIERPRNGQRCAVGGDGGREVTPQTGQRGRLMHEQQVDVDNSAERIDDVHVRGRDALEPCDHQPCRQCRLRFPTAEQLADLRVDHGPRRRCDDVSNATPQLELPLELVERQLAECHDAVVPRTDEIGTVGGIVLEAAGHHSCSIETTVVLLLQLAGVVEAIECLQHRECHRVDVPRVVVLPSQTADHLLQVADVLHLHIGNDTVSE